jgi:hypothetical protein
MAIIWTNLVDQIYSVEDFTEYNLTKNLMRTLKPLSDWHVMSEETQAFILEHHIPHLKYKDSTKRVDLVCFNHNHQIRQTWYVDDELEFQEFMDDFKSVELTLEELHVDGTVMTSNTTLEVVGGNLADIIEAVDTYDADSVQDYIAIFGIAYVENIEAYHTGVKDFPAFAREQAEEFLRSHEVLEEVSRYFDYEAYEADLSHSYSIGTYVWNNV